MAVALGLLVFCVFCRHRKPKPHLVTLESFNGASSSTLPTTVNETTLGTGDNDDDGSLYGGTRSFARVVVAGVPRRARVEAAKDSEASEADEVPRGGKGREPQKMWLGAGPKHKPTANHAENNNEGPSRARVEAAKDSEASEADEFPRGGKGREPQKMWLGAGPKHKPTPNHAEKNNEGPSQAQLAAIEGMVAATEELEERSMGSERKRVSKASEVRVESQLC